MIPEFTPVFSGDHLRAAWFPGTRPLLIVTLDYRKLGRNDFSSPNHSSGFARQGYGQLSISTRRNDWFINPDTEALEQALAEVAAKYTRVQAIGWSMGAYGALRFSKALNLDGVVAISPQWSIARGAIAGDDRYAIEAATFDPALGELARHAKRDLKGVVMVDPFSPHDLAHAQAIKADLPKLRLLRLGFAGHPASRVLKTAGKTWLIQREAAMKRQTGAELIAAHRAARRESAGYWGRLASHAALRRPALAALAQERSFALNPLGSDSDAYGG